MDNLPQSLTILQRQFGRIHAPLEPFDPKSKWDNRYLSWVEIYGIEKLSWDTGGLGIKRKLIADGSVELLVTQVKEQSGKKGTERVRATVTCKNDLLSTPISWKLDSAVLDRSGNIIEYTKNEMTGEVRGGYIVQHREKTRKIKAPATWTGNWCLFDAVQRLPFDTKPIAFTMLEDQELLKPHQVISPGPEAQIELDGRKVRLHSFVHIGDGILPYTYWLDDNHRLLIVVGELCTYLFDPNVAALKEES